MQQGDHKDLLDFGQAEAAVAGGERRLALGERQK